MTLSSSVSYTQTLTNTARKRRGIDGFDHRGVAPLSVPFLDHDEGATALTGSTIASHALQSLVHQSLVPRLTPQSKNVHNL